MKNLNDVNVMNGSNVEMEGNDVMMDNTVVNNNVNMEGNDVEMNNTVVEQYAVLRDELGNLLLKANALGLDGHGYIAAAKEKVNVMCLDSLKAVIARMNAQFDSIYKKNAAKDARINRILSSDKLSAKDFAFALNVETDENTKEQLWDKANGYVERKSHKSYRNINAIKYFSKDIPVVLIRRIECSLLVDDFNGSARFVGNVEVQPQQESELMRHCDVEMRNIADAKMSLFGRSTEDICTLSLGKSLLNGDQQANDMLTYLFRMLTGEAENKITIIIKKTGVATVNFDGNYFLKDGDYAIEYELLGITPSGLRSGSLSLAATAIVTNEDIKNVDKRIDLLDYCSDGAFKETFTKVVDGKRVFKDDYKSTVKLFKDMTRMLMPATASRTACTLKNYVVLDNLNTNAGYNKNDYNTPCKPGDEGFVSCENTSDGNCTIAVEAITDTLKSFHIPYTARDLNGLVFQGRGLGTKQSSTLKSRMEVALQYYAALDNGAKILYIVLDGKRIDKPNKAQRKAVADKIEGLFDENAMKLMNHKAVGDIVFLKKAYLSDTSLNLVVNFMMLLQNEEKAAKLLLKKGRQAIADKMAQLGLDVDIDAMGNVSDVKLDFDKLKSITNDSQTANWLLKQAPKTIYATMPGVIKSMFNNTITSIANMLNILKIDVNSKYTVVQADPSVKFGVRLLHDGEIYCPDFANASRVSGVRHPISGPKAVTTFKTITLDTVLERVEAFNISNTKKNWILNAFTNCDGYCYIPADEYLMEKHDGMDFDIDAMQFFLDEEVVDILSEIEDMGTNIDRSKDIEKDEAGNITRNVSNFNSKGEEVIKDFKENIFSDLVPELRRPIEDNMTSVNSRLQDSVISVPSVGHIENKIDMTSGTAMAHVKRNAAGNYTMDFNSIGGLILDYFLNPVDPVGFIATGFYNNALLYMALNSKFIAKQNKEIIVRILKNKFACKGVSKYVSPIKRNVITLADGSTRTEVTIYKDICTEVMFRYADSFGSMEDTLLFLEDACLCNRYPAETSIDAAKNMYAVIDMFNLTKILQSSGSDKTMTTIVMEDQALSDELYAKYIDAYNRAGSVGTYTKDNFFNVSMIQNYIKDNKFFTKDCSSLLEIFNKISDKMIPVVQDPLGMIRNKLVTYANSIIVLASKEIEKFIISDEAKSIRKSFVERHLDNIMKKDSVYSITSVLGKVINMYITLTDSIDTQLKEDVTVEFEDKSAKQYLKENAKVICKNFAELSFRSAKTPLTQEEIGAAVVYYIINSFEKEYSVNGVCKTLNSNILTIFEEEIVLFFRSIGINIEAGELINFAVDGDGKHIDLAELIDAPVVGYHGHAQDESQMIDIVLKNKKSSFEHGAIKVSEDGMYYAAVDRDSLKSNYDLGLYLPVKKESINLDFNNYNYDEIFFMKKNIDEMGNISRNRIYGVANGERIAICDLFVNKFIGDVLEEVDFTKDQIKFFINEDNGLVYISNRELFDSCSINSIDSNVNDFSFNFDDEYYNSLPQVDMEEEVALDNEEYVSDITPVSGMKEI